MTKIKSSVLMLSGTVVLAGSLSFAQVQRPGEYPRGVKPSPMMNFFVTSEPIGDGGNLGGLAGADAHCQMLATAVGAGNRTWYAYLSTQARPGQPAINARDRVMGKPPPVSCLAYQDASPGPLSERLDFASQTVTGKEARDHRRLILGQSVCSSWARWCGRHEACMDTCRGTNGPRNRRQHSQAPIAGRIAAVAGGRCLAGRRHVSVFRSAGGPDAPHRSRGLRLAGTLM